jgi:hypothetical protein
MISRSYKPYEGNSYSAKSYNSQEKMRQKCSNYGKPGHIKEKCFDIVGYPDWYKGKKGKQQGERGKNHAFAAAIGADASS